VAHRGEVVFCMLSIYHARTDKDSELFEIKLAFLIRKLSRHPATARGCNGAEDVLKFRQAYLSRDAIAIRLGTSKRTASAKSPPSQSTSEGSMEDKQHRNKHDGSIRVGAPSTWWMEALSGSGFAFRFRPARIAICHRHAGGVLLISRQKKKEKHPPLPPPLSSKFALLSGSASAAPGRDNKQHITRRRDGASARGDSTMSATLQ
jgi:hypothetical protein